MAQFFHPVHAVLDRDPPIKSGIFEDAEDGIIIVQTFSDDAVLDRFCITMNRIHFHFPQIFDGPA